MGGIWDKKRPVMLHRTILGSVERFLGILIEQYGGKFPLWLNPNQVSILPIADRHLHFANELKRSFKEKQIRAFVDSRSESTKKKVRDAQLQQYNYILVVGDKEIEDKTVTVRTRNNEIIGTFKIEKFVSDVAKELSERC